MNVLYMSEELLFPKWNSVIKSRIIRNFLYINHSLVKSECACQDIRITTLEWIPVRIDLHVAASNFARKRILITACRVVEHRAHSFPNLLPIVIDKNIVDVLV